MSDALTLDKLLKQNPLCRFSFYTYGQVQTLKRVGEEILRNTESWGSGEVIRDFEKNYDLFWLWMLGAYEVVRTMDENRICFIQEVHPKIRELKNLLAELRIPFAKQQLKGSGKAPIYAELSVVGFRGGLVFSVKSVEYNSREIIRQFFAFVDSFKFEDILQEVPTRRS